jgi:hypothetical protein
MAKIKVASKKKGKPGIARIELPERRMPSDIFNAHAILVTGEKKIGKTKLSIEDVEELVFQYDKPNIDYSIREWFPRTWREYRAMARELTRLAEEGKLPYQRVVVDGAGEWFTSCQTAACAHFGVDHPSEEGYARAWHWMRDEFTDAVNELMQLQVTAGCGLWFLAHSEWKEKKTRRGVKIDRLVPNLPARAEEILNGKVDGWFTYDWDGDDRVLVLLGNEYVGGGHRMDGHFLTTDGRRISELYLGTSSEESAANLLSAFNNEIEHANIEEWREKRRNKAAAKKIAKKVVRKAVK